MNKLLFFTLAIVGSALATLSIHAKHQYQLIEAQASGFPQGAATMTVSVSAVDAETGEAIARAGLGHPVKYAGGSDSTKLSPNISRIFDAESSSTRISANTEQPLTLTMSARDYEAAEFEIDPRDFKPGQREVTIKLRRSNIGSNAVYAHVSE